MNNDIALVHRDEMLPEVRGVNIEALMEKAIDGKSAVEILERLQAMRREIRAEQAKEAFDHALANFQAECPIIVKTKRGAKDAYRYAPLDAILEQTRDLIRAHGFSFQITAEIDQGWCKAICKVTHALGHSSTSEFKVPIDMKNPMMTDPQRYGGAITFAKRYAFCNSFGILTADEDTDGTTSRSKPRGPSSIASDDVSLKDLARELWQVLQPVRGTQRNWAEANKWLWREEILDGAIPETAPNLSAERFREVIAKAKAKV